jgi:hypothetical protein
LTDFQDRREHRGDADLTNENCRERSESHPARRPRKHKSLGEGAFQEGAPACKTYLSRAA